MAFVLEDVVFYLGLIWAAVIIGVLVGWTWKPRWANLERRKLGFAVKSEGSSSAHRVENEKLAVTTEDLEQLCQLVEVKDGGPTWIQMMDRSTPTMSYQAWRRDPKTGPPQYRSSTVFEDAMPELVRDIFWDDEFRSKWDDMLIHTETLEECPTTGTMEFTGFESFHSSVVIGNTQ